MFYVKIKIKESKIHGLGIFADENINKGNKIYQENLILDLLLSKKEFSALSKNEQNTIKHYGYFDKLRKKWHLAFDDIRFCNHSLNGNITLQNGILIAKKNIKKGEELTQNFEEFEELREELRNK